MTGFKFGRTARLLTAVLASAAGWASLGAGTAAAATLQVCQPALTCTYSSITAAIAQAAMDYTNDHSADVITVGPGVYQENLDINTPVTIEGLDGAANTIIEPDLSTINNAPAFTLDSGALKNYPVVYADGPDGGTNVALENLTVDGLDDGGSVDQSFEGIAAYDTTLTVNDVHVIGISDGPPYGTQTSYGILDVNDGKEGAELQDAYVTNSVVSDYQVNGIAVEGNSDTNVDIAGNTVVGDGPAPFGGSGIAVSDLSWETPTPPAGPVGTVANNDVTANVCIAAGCGSDILSSDIAGDAAGIRLTNDDGLTVSGNDVSDNDIGLWSTTAPGATTTVSSNTLEGNLYADVLAGYGASIISANTIGGPALTPKGDGVLVAGYHPDTTAANATITANTISGTDVAVEVAQGLPGPSPTPSVMIANNAISGNTQGIENNTMASVNAADNWFGCNGGPGAIGCDTITGTGASDVTTSPYLVLTTSALPGSITPGSTTTLLASIRQDSAGNAFPSGPFPSGVPVTFATTSGSTDAAATLVNGRATTTLSGTALGTATVTGTLDNQSATATVATANPVSTASSVAPATITVTVSVPAAVQPLIGFLSQSKLSLLAANPGSELSVVCVDGCSASVAGKIVLTLKHAKHRTLTLAPSQLTVAAGGSSVYAVALTASQRNSVKHAVSATLTLSVSAKDDTSGKTITGSKSFSLTRS